jgi:hypothetical protein
MGAVAEVVQLTTVVRGDAVCCRLVVAGQVLAYGVKVDDRYGIITSSPSVVLLEHGRRACRSAPWRSHGVSVNKRPLALPFAKIEGSNILLGFGLLDLEILDLHLLRQPNLGEFPSAAELLNHGS